MLSEDHGPSSQHFQMGGIAHGGLGGDVVGQWGLGVDIRGDNVP